MTYLILGHQCCLHQFKCFNKFCTDNDKKMNTTIVTYKNKLVESYSQKTNSVLYSVPFYHAPQPHTSLSSTPQPHTHHSVQRPSQPHTHHSVQHPSHTHITQFNATATATHTHITQFNALSVYTHPITNLSSTTHHTRFPPPPPQLQPYPTLHLIMLSKYSPFPPTLSLFYPLPPTLSLFCSIPYPQLSACPPSHQTHPLLPLPPTLSLSSQPSNSPSSPPTPNSQPVLPAIKLTLFSPCIWHHLRHNLFWHGIIIITGQEILSLSWNIDYW